MPSLAPSGMSRTLAGWRARWRCAWTDSDSVVGEEEEEAATESVVVVPPQPLQAVARAHPAPQQQ
eukprot:1369331-Rhodomonas_salina.1